MSPFAHKLLGEGVGSAILFATVVGSGIMAESLAGGNVAVALLGNPAITVARSLSNSFAGIAPCDVPGFIAAQLAGALAAHGLAKLLFAADKKTGGTRS